MKNNFKIIIKEEMPMSEKSKDIWAKILKYAIDLAKLILLWLGATN